MSKQPFQFAKGRFVNPARILTAHIYQKDETDNSGQATGRKILRVAIELDTLDKAKSSIFSDAMPDLAAAESFINSIPFD